MANTFKNAKAVDVDNSTPATLYTVPSSTTTIILSLNLCNKNAASRTVTVNWTDGSDSDASTVLLNEVAIPGDTTLEVLSGQKIVLMTDDVLKVVASAASSIDATLSYMEIT
tara:strand:+ start:43 stop:378 length:336 start_codon:yes stop_codon:yes gene_type:complete